MQPKSSSAGLPVSPKLPLIGLMCMLAGLGVGVALVYVLDVLDDRFRSPEELQKAITLFAKALEHDPLYAPAYAAMADSWMLMALYHLSGAGKGSITGTDQDLRVQEFR